MVNGLYQYAVENIRSYMKESFYNSALRSYQDLQDNYFEEQEEKVNTRNFVSINGRKIFQLVSISLESVLTKMGNTRSTAKRWAGWSHLKELRSYYSGDNKILYLNKALSPAQEKFLLGREIAFQFPEPSTIHHVLTKQ